MNEATRQLYALAPVAAASIAAFLNNTTWYYRSMLSTFVPRNTAEATTPQILLWLATIATFTRVQIYLELIR
jgi:hypothetical protein